MVELRQVGFERGCQRLRQERARRLLRAVGEQEAGGVRDRAQVEVHQLARQPARVTLRGRAPQAAPREEARLLVLADLDGCAGEPQEALGRLVAEPAVGLEIDARARRRRWESASPRASLSLSVARRRYPTAPAQSIKKAVEA